MCKVDKCNTCAQYRNMDCSDCEGYNNFTETSTCQCITVVGNYTECKSCEAMNNRMRVGLKEY